MSTSRVPAYYVRGDDQSLVDAAVHILVTELAGDDASMLAVEDYRAGQTDVSAVVDSCSTPPFLTGMRIVVYRDIGELDAAGAEIVTAYLGQPLETTVLVLVSGGGRAPAALEKAVKAAGGTTVDAALPSGAKGKSDWLAAKIGAGPVRLDSRARENLASHLGEDLERVDGLLASLEAAYGTGGKIGDAELEPFLGSAGDVPPWDLTDAIDRGDAAGALRYLGRMMEAGNRQALGIMAILHRHFSEMLTLDGQGVSGDGDAAKVLGISSSFRAGKVRKQGTKLGGARIARAVTLLAGADSDLRGGTGWEPGLVMEVLVARLSRLVAQRVPAG